MALIECPYCGGKISDTAKSCVHCGKPLKLSAGQEVTAQKAEPAKEQKTMSVSYSSLSKDEKLRLDRQFFYEEYKNYGEDLDNLRSIDECRSTVAFIAAIAIPWLAALVLIISNIDLIETNNLLFVCAISIIAFLALFSIILVIVFSVKLYECNNKKIVALKKYSEWLAKKNINFIPTFFSSRHVRYYEFISTQY